MDKNITKLFVYGTLRSDLHHPAYQLIAPHFFLLCKAIVRGRLFDLGEFPGAVPSAEDSFVVGELYELKKSSRFESAIVALDDYEGINYPDCNEQLFYRDLTKVFCNHQSTSSWVYWYNQDVAGKQVIPSGDFLDQIKYNTEL